VQRLTSAHELLDGDLADRRSLEGNLRDLRRINRLLGGTRLSRRAIEALLPHDRDRIEVLDIGTGAADIPEALVGDKRRTFAVTAIDSRTEVIEAALRSRPRLAALPGLTLRVGDGRSLPFGDASFDVAHGSMLLHHLDVTDARALIAEMARVARRGIVLNDLARGRGHWIAAWVLLHVATTNAFTRHDGPLSVRRAWSLAEATRLVESCGLRVVHARTGIAGHRWALAAVRR
jgi:ubiquinone/menaquinone biosynthesis C-methylase UbiE